MSNVFSKKNGRPNRVKRNTFDLSFQNNLTTKFGQLTPVFCKEVLPGDSFTIDTAFGLRFMPTYFPLQTRMRADVHFFYVRNRNLWKDWPDFIGQTDPKSVPPYIHFDNQLKTSSIFDYMGMPTTYAGTAYTYSNFINSNNYLSSSPAPGYRTLTGLGSSSPVYYYTQSGIGLPSDTTQLRRYAKASGESPSYINLPSNSSGEYSFTLAFPLLESLSLAYDSPFRGLFPELYLRQLVSNAVPFKVQPYSAYLAYATNPAEVAIQPIGDADLVPTSDGLYSFSFPSFSKEDVDLFNENAANGRYLMFTFSVPAASSNPQIPALPSGPYQTLGLPFSRTEYAFAYNPPGDLTVDISSVPSGQNPFNSHNSGHIKISALPFRAYESIYNSFYRDDRNNPRVVDGRPEYNKYITTDAGGQDNTQYGLMFRNWEQDFLTTAVPSPQQGVAPLVGISSTGTMTFSDPDDPDRTYQVEAKTADDADTIVGVNYLENVPASVQRSLLDVVSSGISINDFRNVNAYQRWLETNIRRGLKYKDQIKSHFDVNVSYAELDMPEFIGGVSQPVQVATVDQTSAGSVDNPLGSYAGQAFALGKSKHKVRHYCDEHGFIIGILSVVPVPNYSQLLPKYFLKNETLDYFFPEFGKIGYQPIRNSEVDPVNAWAEGATNVNNVFGYQRPWYDYLSSVDEVHGDFRLSLRSFLLNRVFLGTPKLGPSFTVIDPDQLNDVFSDTEDNDKILGQLYFEVYAKRPIPRYGVPSLEANV